MKPGGSAGPTLERNNLTPTAEPAQSSGAEVPPFERAPLDKSYATVKGKQMTYHQVGDGGRSIVFLHGNPTSSYLWRNVIPHVSDRGRCIAPDLIGHGDSDKLDDVGVGTYRFVDHRAYLDGLLDQLELGDDIVFVVHDWGSALGFDWANRHRDRVSGIAFMEAFVRPLSWEEWPGAGTDLFKALRSEAGEQLIIDENLFVEAVLPRSILRDLTKDEHDEYRRPFIDREHRRPTLTWPRQIPLDGEPADVHEIVSAYADWLSSAKLPKLFVNAEPGAILIGLPRAFCRGWPNLTEVTVAGRHYIQEDSPHEIGRAIANWLPAHP
jgi:haloalkane dehalogenase